MNDNSFGSEMLRQEKTIEIIDKEIEQFNAKHRRLRGSMDYKYPPMAAACKSGCGLSDDSVGHKDHRCVLAIGHKGEHEWSWECGVMKAKMAVV